VASVVASDFKFNGRMESVLNQLRQLARIEGRLELIQEDLARLENKVKQTDLRADLTRFRQHIQPYLETELVSRYYYQRGALQHQAAHDKNIRKAIETLR
jgi:carboxyl-terminal processing protease